MITSRSGQAALEIKKKKKYVDKAHTVGIELEGNAWANVEDFRNPSIYWVS